MEFLWEKIKSFIMKITLKDIIYGIIILLLIGALSSSVSQCSSIKHQYKNNIAALNDTIHYYKAENGQLVAKKLAFETDIKDLEMLNKDLFEELENLNAKYELVSGTHFGGVVEYEVHDTIMNGFSHDFAFNNEFRKLEGNVNYKNDTVGVKINKDEMYFDYTVAMDKKNNIYITSKNPYVKYNEMTGFQVPKQKRKRWSLGPSVQVGYGAVLHDGKVIGAPNVSVGVSLNYGLIQF